MINLLKTFFKKPSKNIILLKNPIMALMLVASVVFYEIFLFLSSAVPIKIVLIMAMHRLPEMFKFEILDNYSNDDVIILLIEITVLSYFLCFILKTLYAYLKILIKKKLSIDSIKIQQNLIDLEIISFTILFLLYFYILAKIDLLFSIIVLIVTFFLIFCISIYLNFLKLSFKNVFLEKLKKNLSNSFIKKSIILAIGNIFVLIISGIMVLFYFFYELRDGFYLIIAMMMIRRIGACITRTFQKQILINSLMAKKVTKK